MALGATFSALEVVPLVLMGFEAWDNVKLSRSTSWIKAYKWPVYCLLLLHSGILSVPVFWISY